MKKIFIFLACTLVVVGATAGVSMKTDYLPSDGRSLMGETTEKDSHGTGQINPMSSPSVTDPYVINEIPEGQLKTYTRTGGYIYHRFVETGIEEIEDVMNVVFAEDGKVYIQNPVAWLSNGNWVEGSLDEATGIISVPTGQYVAWFPERGYGGQLM